jgi:hypothetical protein
MSLLKRIGGTTPAAENATPVTRPGAAFEGN